MAFQRRGFKRSKTLHKPTIKSLPPDLLIDIVARVGSTSITDLANVKLSCKELDEASKDGYVLEHLSMDKLSPVNWSKSNQKATLLRRSKESGNPNALYRQGMVEFFDQVKLESGLENLRRAAEKGHMEACYVYGMILLCCGEARGTEVLSTIKSFRNCRHKVKTFVRDMWMKNPLAVAAAALSHEEAKTCPCPCSYVRMRGWEEEDCICGCRLDREVDMFCNILAGRS